ncbi:tRNA-intron endonuclease catalytic domain-like protein [Armillaria gallica]|uniref:tRNA-splicing endonuclease subunit Sen34 n=1 Tax=Armillaria gallica TaxID=47427 RepID=A0A2H3DN78_ARMGA|nr:tRNA-intron endonuclease catalytic domain-like protein [Armillaria gallica]
MTDSNSRIPISVVNKRAFIWEVDDIAVIRAKYRICGILTGTLPHVSQQNVFLGVPLLLMPEEVVLLVENGSAVLVDDPRAYPEPSPEQIKEWDSARLESIQKQVSIAESLKGTSTPNTRSMSEEAVRKRREREQRKAKPTEEEEEVEPTPKTSVSGHPAYNIVIPASSSSMKWYSPDACTYASIDSAKAAGIWDYPSNLHERAKCGVFRSLWEQGYFMGGGIKFGGDYLVYPGDPMRYHSHFTATVIDSPLSALQPMEIVAHGRLGTATKKAHLICCWDDEKREVTTMSIEWAGFG